MKRSLMTVALLTLLLAGAQAAWAQSHHDDPPPQMKVPPATSGFLGAKFAIVDDEAAEKLGLAGSGGLIFIEIVTDSPAEKAGLQNGDVILKVDGEETPDRDSFIEKMSTTKPGQEIAITIMRDKEEQEIPVTLGVRPPGFGTTQPSTRPG